MSNFSINDLVRENELFSTSIVVMSGIAVITFIVCFFDLQTHKAMAQAGYTQVQTVGTTTLHWEKR